MTIRVVLAEDNALLREGIARMIGADDDFELIGVASDYPELIELIDRDEPDRKLGQFRGHAARRAATGEGTSDSTGLEFGSRHLRLLASFSGSLPGSHRGGWAGHPDRPEPGQGVDRDLQ